MKKRIYITLSILAGLGVSYFIYKKVKDRNKEIIKDGGFTIKVSEDATTNMTAPPQDSTTTDSSYDSYDSDYSIEQQPAWSSSDTTTDYSEYLV